MPKNKPLVAVVSDRRQVDEAHYFHMVGEKYLQALISAAGVYPIGLPSMADDLAVAEILDQVDGLFLTGSPSNVEPARFRTPHIRRPVVLEQRLRALSRRGAH